MNIDGVENGIVIDHIQAGECMRLYDLLGLEKLDCSVAIIKNAASRKYGRKDIIKIDELIDLDLDALGYIDPRITVNEVENSQLVRKRHLALPERLTNIVSCRNPRCITSVEADADQVFRLADRDKRLYRCAYCEVAVDENTGRR